MYEPNEDSEGSRVTNELGEVGTIIRVGVHSMYPRILVGWNYGVGTTTWIWERREDISASE